MMGQDQLKVFFSLMSPVEYHLDWDEHEQLVPIRVARAASASDRLLESPMLLALSPLVTVNSLGRGREKKLNLYEP